MHDLSKEELDLLLSIANSWAKEQINYNDGYRTDCCDCKTAWVDKFGHKNSCRLRQLIAIKERLSRDL